MTNEYLNTLWPEKDWLKPVCEITIELPRLAPSRVFQEKLSDSVTCSTSHHLDDQLSERLTRSSGCWIAELYETQIFYSWELAITVACYRYRHNLAGSGVATLLSNEEFQRRIAERNRSVYFPLGVDGQTGRGCNMDFWEYHRVPSPRLSLLSAGSCPAGQLLVLYRSPPAGY